MALLDLFRNPWTTARPYVPSGEPDTSHFEPQDVPERLAIFENERAAPVLVPEMHRRFGPYGGFQHAGRDIPIHELRRAYSSLVYFLANYRARAFSRHLLRLKVQRREAQGEYADIDPDNPNEGARFWLELLQRPNEYMSPFQFYKWLCLNRDLTRGAHCVVEYERRRDLGGLLLPRYLHPVYAEDGPVEPRLNGVGEVTGWVHHRADGQDVEYAAGEIIRVCHEHPLHRGRGASLIEAAAYEIDHAIAARIYGRDQAQDQGLPDVILEADDMIDQTTGNQISRDFAAKYRAGSRSRAAGAQGVPWTAGGLKAKPLTLNARDMQFLEIAQLNKEDLFTIMEVQLALFNDEAYATGQEGAQRGFAVNTVQPNVIEIADQMEFEYERIFRADRGALRLEVPNVIPMNRKEQMEIDEIRIRTGTPINRILAERGEEDVEGGDVPMVSGMLQPLVASGGME